MEDVLESNPRPLVDECGRHGCLGGWPNFVSSFGGNSWSIFFPFEHLFAFLFSLSKNTLFGRMLLCILVQFLLLVLALFCVNQIPFLFFQLSS